MGSIGIILPLVHFYGINTSRWTYRSWTYPWIHKGMDLVLQDMRPSELKFALVLSLWHPWSHLPGNGEGPKVPLTKNQRDRMVAPRKLPASKHNCWLYHSYHLTSLISWTPFFPVHVHMNHASTHQFFHSLRNAPCFFVVSRFQTTQLFGENPLKVVKVLVGFFFKCQPHGEKYGPQKLHKIFHPKVRGKKPSKNNIFETTETTGN